MSVVIPLNLCEFDAHYTIARACLSNVPERMFEQLEWKYTTCVHVCLDLLRLVENEFV